MPFNENIPQSTDIPATSQAQLLANFKAIKTLVDVNHDTFSAADEGKHKFANFPEQGVNPATAVNEVALFSRESTLTGISELCVRNENNGTIYEFTSRGVSWTRLPSGILLKWGIATADGDSTVTFPVAANIPAFTTCYSVQLTLVVAAAGDADQAVRLKSYTNLDFNCYGSKRITLGSHLVGFTYLAIGI